MAETRTDQLARQSRVLRRIREDSPFDVERGAASIRFYNMPDEGSVLSWDRELTAPDLTHITVKRGREAANETPGPGTLTFGVRVRSADDLMLGETGRRLEFRIESSLLKFLNGGVSVSSSTHHNYYQAWVTDAQLSYVSTGNGRPPKPVLNITATGPKARAALTRVGDVPWPAEALKLRRNRIYNLIQWAAFPDIGNPFGNGTGMNTTDGDLVVSAADIDRQDPVSLLDDYAADVGAIVAESLREVVGNMVTWQPLDYRANEDALVELTADEVASTATWGRSLNGLVNRYTVTYGPEEARAEVTVVDQQSIDQYGDFAASRDTQLVNRADAERLATLIVGRNSRPRWTITRFDVDLLDLKLPGAKALELLGRGEVGELIRIAGLPTTAPDVRAFHIEGTELRVTRHDLMLTVYVSEAGQTGAPPTWERLNTGPTGLTWEQLDPTMSWLRSAGWYLEPTETFRWLDAPGNQAWVDLRLGATGRDGDSRVPTWASYPDDPA